MNESVGMYQLEVERLNKLLQERDNKIELLNKEHSEDMIIHNKIKVALKEENQKLQKQFKNYINENNKEKLELVNRILELEGQNNNNYNDDEYDFENDKYMSEYADAFWIKTNNMKEDDTNAVCNY